LASGPAEPALLELRARLEQEEQAYAEVLAALDALSAFRLPAEASPRRARSWRCSRAVAAARAPAGRRSRRALRRRAWDALAPAVERQTAFDPRSSSC